MVCAGTVNMHLLYSEWTNDSWVKRMPFRVFCRPTLASLFRGGVYNTATVISFPPRDNGLVSLHRQTLTLWILHPALSYSQAYTTHAVKVHCARLALAKLTKVCSCCSNAAVTRLKNQGLKLYGAFRGGRKFRAVHFFLFCSAWTPSLKSVRLQRDTDSYVGCLVYCVPWTTLYW